MGDVDVDIDAIGRKELQALAKSFGIKANQKSVVLREKLRETLFDLKHEEKHDDDSPEQSEDLIEDVSIVSEDAKATSEENEKSHSAATKIDVHQDTTNILEPSERDSNAEEKKNCADDHSTTKKSDNEESTILEGNEREVVENNLSAMSEAATVTTEQKDDAVNETTKIEDNTITEDDENQIPIEKMDPVGKQMEEIKQVAMNNNLTTKPRERELLSTTKISLGVEKDSIKKYCHKNTDEKFTSHLAQPLRTNHGMKPSTKLLEKKSGQPAEGRFTTSTVRQPREVPLWKVHSKDFLRKRGADKSRDSNLKKTDQPRPKLAERKPFRDRSNNKQLTSKKPNVNKDDIKRITPKPLPMSKRNEEQMKKFLERQSVGRKDRAKREQVKMYANCVRD